MPHRILISWLSLLLAALACNAPLPTPAPQSDWTPRTKVPTSTGAIAPEATDACFNLYQPVVEGATWAYQVTGITSDTFTRAITARSAEGFSGQDVFGSGTIRSSEWKCAGGNLTDLQAGANVATDGQNITFTTTASSGVTLPANLAPLMAWTQLTALEGTNTIGGKELATRTNVTINCQAVGKEPVSVPAGEFEALRVDCATKIEISTVIGGQATPLTSLDFTSSAWYASGVGMVKSDGTTPGEGETHITLISYQIPGR